MPLFYLDYKDDDGNHRDDEGSDLPSFEKARDLAIGLLPDISSFRRDGHREFSTTVRDKDGKSLYRATMTFRGEVVD